MELPTLDHSGATAAAVVVPVCGNGQTLNDAADDAFERRVRASRMINAALFLVASAVIVGVVFLGMPSYGVFGDEYLWMKYQVSRVSAPYTSIRSILFVFRMRHLLDFRSQQKHIILSLSTTTTATTDAGNPRHIRESDMDTNNYTARIIHLRFVLPSRA